MSETQNPPKLFVNKPKKGLHPRGGVEKREPVASKVAAATSATMQQPNVTPVPLKAPFWYRYRAAVGGLLLLNLGIGGYVLSRPKSKLDAVEQPTNAETAEAQVEKEQVSSEPKPVPVMATPVAIAPEWVPAAKPVVSPEQQQQREVLQWVLQEKRKVKPQDKKEKARINEEKRLLKELLRGSQLLTLP